MSRLVFVGEVVVDLVIDVPALPESGGDVVARSSRATPGGGFNVMAAAARQGLAVVYVGGHGSGPWGQLARVAMEGEDIAVPEAEDPAEDTGLVVALVDPSGERTFVTSLGAEARVDAERLGRVEVAADDFVYLSGYGLAYPGNAPLLADWVRALPSSVRVLTDPGPLVADVPAASLSEVRARTDWWSCNEREARLLTGIDDPEAAAATLQAATRRAGVLVRTGAAGCVLALRDRAVQRIPAPTVDAVDTNGAGDAHAGIFIAALATGMSPGAAAWRANAGAALAVTRRGPSTAPTRQELDAFIAQAPGSST